MLPVTFGLHAPIPVVRLLSVVAKSMAFEQERVEAGMINNNAATADLVHAEILWKSADALRGQIDAAEYKHVVLGLLFLKYISDSFEARRGELKGELDADGISGPQLESLLENRDEYTAEADLLGAARGTLAEPPKPGCASGHRHTDRRRHPRRSNVTTRTLKVSCRATTHAAASLRRR